MGDHTNRRATGRLLALASVGLCAGCYRGLAGEDLGAAEGGQSADHGNDDGGDGGGDEDGTAACDRAGPALPRLLTRAQYRATIRDLLGIDTDVTDAFLPDAQVGGYWNNSDQPMTVAAAELYMHAAEAIAAEVNLEALAPCGAEADPRQCARDFIVDLGGRAYRRPLADDQVERLIALYDGALADPEVQADRQAALRLVLQAILQSPMFLAHIELGDPSLAADDDGEVPLTSHELASRLSYTLCGTMPDAELFAAADGGTLEVPEGRLAQAERLLDDPRCRPVVRAFFLRWLRLDEVASAAKEPARYPEFDADLAARMAAQAEAFVDHVLWGGDDGTLRELLTADYALVDQRLAELYGIAGVVGDDLVRVELDDDARAGVLGLPAWLATMAGADQSSPTKRGLFVRSQLLCQHIPAPPGDVVPNLPPALPGETPPERVARHLEDPACGGCHAIFDPVGLGFEHFDAIGRHRDSYEAGAPVSGEGELVGTGDDALDGPFVGLRELAARLAQSDVVLACAGTQALEYALGRAADESCSQASVAEGVVADGGDLRQLLLHVVTSEAFRLRAPSQDDVPSITEGC